MYAYTARHIRNNLRIDVYGHIRTHKDTHMKKLIIPIIILLVLVIAAPAVTIVSYIPTYEAEKAREEAIAKEKARLEQLQAEAEYIPEYDGKNAEKIPILTYHMLVPSDDTKHQNKPGASLFIRQSVFEEQMKYLYDNGYRTIGTKEMYLWHRGEIKLPPKSVMITFDDGSYSIAKFALPVLQKYGQRATIFSIGIGAIKETTDTTPTEKGNYESMGTDQRTKIRNTYPKLEFQGHTFDLHGEKNGKPLLRVSSVEEMTNDFIKMREVIDCDVMAYPYGAYNKKTIKAAKAAGVKMAFTYGENDYATRDQSIYELRRIKISANAALDKFTRWLQ